MVAAVNQANLTLGQTSGRSHECYHEPTLAMLSGALEAVNNITDDAGWYLDMKRRWCCGRYMFASGTISLKMSFSSRRASNNHSRAIWHSRQQSSLDRWRPSFPAPSDNVPAGAV